MNITSLETRSSPAATGTPDPHPSRPAGRTRGGTCAPGATRVLAAWVCHLRGLGAPVTDVRASEVVPLAKGPLAEAVPRVLAALDPALGADTGVVMIVVDQSKEFSRRGR